MNYYAAPNMSGEGTYASPGEFNKLINILKPGDVLYVMPGTYNYDHQISGNLQGTPDSYICITGYDKYNLPIFDFCSEPYNPEHPASCNGFHLLGQYVYISNMIIANAGYKGIRSELSDSILENIEVYGSCDSGIHLASGGNNFIVDCISHDNFGYKTSKRGHAMYGFSSDGISDKLHDGPPNTFLRCKTYNNSDDGFDFYERETNEYTIMKDCESYDNGKKSFDMLSHPRYEIDKEWFDNIAEKEEFSLTNYPGFGNGVGFKLGGNGKANNIICIGCYSHDNRIEFSRNCNTGKIKQYECIENTKPPRTRHIDRNESISIYLEKIEKFENILKTIKKSISD